MKVFVPLTHEGAKGWIFNLVCQGNAMSVSHEGLLLLKTATFNKNLGFGEVCKEKRVTVAYNNDVGIFWVSNITGEMLEYPEVMPYVDYDGVAKDWEIQAAFFKYNNVTPHWINCNYTWGWLDNVTNTWTGATGLIERDEADYAIANFAGTYPRSKVAAFPPGTAFAQDYWLTRYPSELPPMWNLFGLFTKGYKVTNNSVQLIQQS